MNNLIYHLLGALRDGLLHITSAVFDLGLNSGKTQSVFNVEFESKNRIRVTLEPKSKKVMHLGL